MANEKKSAVFYILKILQEYSDKKHTLTYAAIADKLYSSYGIEIERKTIASAIELLESQGYDIIKCGKNGLYLGERDYEEGELLFLVDAIYSSKSMPTKYAKDLVNRLTKSFSRYEKKRFSHLEKIDDGTRADNREIFLTIEMLNDAIECGKKVEFQYGAYGIDKKLQLKESGRYYKINPYFMVNNRGKYYLVCNYDNHDGLANNKIECISNVKVIDEEIKPITSLSGCSEFSIKDYIKQHIYMVSGKTVDAKVKIHNEKRVNDFIDWFGKDVYFINRNGDIVASIKVNEEALIYWAMQYGEHVEIIEPLSTRERLKERLENMCKQYSNKNT